MGNDRLNPEVVLSYLESEIDLLNGNIDVYRRLVEATVTYISNGGNVSNKKDLDYIVESIKTKLDEVHGKVISKLSDKWNTK